MTTPATWGRREFALFIVMATALTAPGCFGRNRVRRRTRRRGEREADDLRAQIDQLEQENERLEKENERLKKRCP